MKSFPILIVYWGKRGGGARFFFEIIHELCRIYPESRFLCSVRPEIYAQLSEKDRDQIQNVVPDLILLDLLPFTVLRHRHRRFFVRIQSLGITHILDVMPHPSNTKIGGRFFPKSLKLINIVHDVQRHAGDFWPNSLAIKSIQKADILLSLSSYVHDQLDHPDKYLATLNRKSNPIVQKPLELNFENYFLVIGRLKVYKGLDWINGFVNFETNFKLVIAGLGAQKFVLNDRPNIKVIDRWLSDSEFEFLIKNASAVISTHLEASQSGIISQAIAWNTPVIAVPVGGITDQIRYVPSIKLSKKFSISELVGAMQLASELKFEKADSAPDDKSVAVILSIFL